MFHCEICVILHFRKNWKFFTFPKISFSHFAFRILRNFAFRISHFAKFRISHFAKFRISHFANCEISHFAFRKMRNFAFRISHLAKFRISQNFACENLRNFANFRIIFVFAETDFWRFAKTLACRSFSLSVYLSNLHLFKEIVLIVWVQQI